MIREQQASLVVCVAVILVACVGPTSKPLPLSSSSDAANTQLVLEESYWATMDGVVVHLPYGVYRAALEDKRGVYYRAPYPIKRKWLLFGSERLVDGGIFVPSSSSQRWLGLLWVYILRDDGWIETHQLPGEIHSGEGSLWRIEPIGDPVNSQVRADCSNGVVSGRYELALPDGTLEVSGSFTDGQRNGLFTFYRSSGEKIAEVPYIQDQISGTVKLWYGPEYGTTRKKATARYLDGQPEGSTEGWYPDGSVLERSTYVDGVLESTEIHDQQGRRLPDAAARVHVDSARDADRKYFEVLAEVVEENLPSCAPS
jgi:hypothetical protein